MTDLTEQWKNGELPDGMYYMENTSGIIGIVGHSKVFPCYNVKQILAPVPSYQEYLESESHCAVYSEVNKSLKEKNVKLKELLKEVRDAWVIYKPYDRSQLCKRIDNAIGEK